MDGKKARVAIGWFARIFSWFRAERGIGQHCVANFLRKRTDNKGNSVRLSSLVVMHLLMYNLPSDIQGRARSAPNRQSLRSLQCQLECGGTHFACSRTQITIEDDGHEDSKA